MQDIIQDIILWKEPSKEGNIAVIEFKSISRGIIVTDSMVKASEVRIVLSTSLCPGKYLTVLEGDVAALENTVKVADRIGGVHVFSSEIITGINLKVIEAIGGRLCPFVIDSIGIVESPHISHLVKAADISIDSAKVEFLDFRLARGCGVNSFYIVTGTFSSVSEAMKESVSYLGEKGSLIGYKILPGPDKEVIRWLRSSLCRC
ncbi:MAG: BMC domain-containing protein [Actinobacteria bacterium]|nr:BMC domain-containing protein [Actinomycetota bacterium]